MSVPKHNAVGTYTCERWQRERWERGSRYYEILVHQDLWGQWITTRINGRRGHALGQIKHQRADTENEARRAAEELARRRRQRRYLLSTANPSVNGASASPPR